MHLTFYSRKQKRLETIALEWQPNGWRLRHGVSEANAAPDGGSHLQQYMAGHATPVPAAFFDTLEELWEAFHRGLIDPAQLEARLEWLSAWLLAYEKNPNQDFRDFLTE